MYQKQCRLALADKFYFGGGAPDIPQRDPGAEWQNLKKFGKANINQFEQFTQRDPMLNMLNKGAMDYFNSPTSPLLSALQSQGLDYFKSPVAGQSALLQNLNQRAMTPSALQAALSQRAMTPSALLTQMNQQAMNQGPSDLLKQMQAQAQQEIATGGKLTPEQARDAEQASLSLSAGAGMAGGTQGLAAALLNRDKYSNERLKQYQAYGQGVEGLGQSQVAEAHKYGLGVEGANQAFNQFGLGVGGLENQFNQFGLGTQAQNTADAQRQRQDIESRYGLAEDIQKLSNQDIMQRFQIPQSVFQTGIAGYTGLTDPIYKYFGDLASSNQNAAAAESVAGANNKAGQTSGILGTIGTVAAAAVTAY